MRTIPIFYMLVFGLMVPGALQGTGVAASTPLTLTGGPTLYQAACAYCHGPLGQGGVRESAPKLWGADNALTHSVYRTPHALGQFIQQNMPTQPVNGINPKSLSTRQAQSLARYILDHPQH